jgi:hypothetical protein
MHLVFQPSLVSMISRKIFRTNIDILSARKGRSLVYGLPVRFKHYFDEKKMPDLSKLSKITAIQESR